MSALVIRWNGPPDDVARYRLKPRLSISAPVCQARSTAPSRPVAVNETSFTAVVTTKFFANSDVLPKAEQAAPLLQKVVVALTRSPTAPANVVLNAREPPPGCVTFTEPAKASPSP